MSSAGFSRRHFLAGASGTAAGAWLRASLPAIAGLSASACTARDKGAAFTVLSAAEAREFEAIAARILPTTDTPGAREAGVIHFIDLSFGSIFQHNLEFARAGLAEFQAVIPARYPGVRYFAELDEADQDEHLAEHQELPFFGLVHFMTVAGFFGMSSYGGNRDHIGWQLLGFESRHAWEPPFGFYDAEHLKATQDDG